ncbi:TipJ family phage tail tip protein [Moraxella bovoculi]|uniref:host specificity protein J n=1 Tax=Moraxella bovoculi TaxID=386891 RepID=UPI003F4FB9AA
MIYGAKKGSKGQQRPNIAKDTTASTNYFQGLYGLSEGEVYGLVDGGKSIKLDGTPLINDNGQPNFENVTWEFRNGTIDQEHIKGFSSVENEQSVGVELRHDRPFTRAISNTQLSAVVIRLNWRALREQKDDGDIVGYKIDYAIDVQTDGGAWATVLNTTINDKASQGYQRSHRIDLPDARRGWTVRVRRITPNRDSDLIADTMSVQAITEVIDAKLRYPCTSLLAIKYDAQTFGNVAKVAVRMRGMIVQVPSNYNAQTRTYTGVWDGTFKPAYTNNPAWVFYDLCTATRYGLGERLAGKVDKWSLYALGQYCDEMVDDGMGGREPRFTVNVYIQKAQDAYQVLQSLASVFRAMSYWDGTQIIVDADTPKEPVYTFTNANVVNGAFSYTGTRKRDRHSIAKVAYDDPDNDFKTDYVHVRDEFAIAKYGISIIDINAFGCTSRAQAYRAGAWALQSEQLETETVTFNAGLDGFIPKVGEVINVSDNARAGRANGGRVVSASGRTVTLDRTAGRVGDTFVINSTDGQAKTAKITAIRGAVVTLDKAVGAAAGAVWAMTSSDLAPRQFRVMSIKQNDDNTFGITGLQYEPSKFSASDNGARAIARPVSVIKPQVLDTPSNIVITGHNRVVQGQNVTTLTINWAQVVGAVGYIAQWRKDDNAWQTLPAVASQSIDIDGVYAGSYQARVRAVDAFDNHSLMGVSDITRIDGKRGKPPRLANLTVQGVLFGMNLTWGFGANSADTNYTEIEVSPDGRSNISTLGTFAYPTNKHEITGLQGNLTQYYRARIVDKLGNTSDWTAWMGGTTSADAAKVLDLISGHISESHLDRALREPIAKIADFDNKFGSIDGRINQFASRFNSEMPTIEQSVQQVNARLPQLNRSIDDLMSDKNAKTQEIVNIKRTLGNTTTQIRDVVASTGNLTRRFSEMVVDQQHNHSTLNARMQSIQDSIVSKEQALSRRISELDTAYRSADTQSNAKVRQLEQSISSKEQALSERISRLDSDYKQADSQASAKIGQVERSLSDKERSLSERISQIDTAYKSADRTANAKMRQLEQTQSTNTQALFSQIRQAKAEFAEKERQASSRIGQVEQSISDKERALSERVSQLSSTLQGKIDGIKIGGNNLWCDKTTQVGKYLSNGRVHTTSGTDAVSDYISVSGGTDYVIQIWGIRRAALYVNVNYFDADKRFIKYYLPVLDDVANNQAFHSVVKMTTPRNAKFVRISARNLRDNAKYQLEKGNIPSDYRPCISSVASQVGASANVLQEVRSNVERIDGRMASEARKVATLQTTVARQTTSIRNVEQSVNGVRAIKAVTVDNNGVISGYGLMSELQNGRVNSQFGVHADSFYIGSPRNGKKPFATYTQPTVINGVRIPAGTYIDTAFIANASITMAKISDSIKSDNYVPGRQGWRLFKDGRFELNNTFGDGSSLELNSKGLIVWYNKAQGKKAVELGIFT